MFGQGLSSTQGEFHLYEDVDQNQTWSGEQHRKQRKMLNPVFSIVHMRNMGTTLCSLSSWILYCEFVHLVPMFSDIAKKVGQIVHASTADNSHF